MWGGCAVAIDETTACKGIPAESRRDERETSRNATRKRKTEATDRVHSPWNGRHRNKRERMCPAAVKFISSHVPAHQYLQSGGVRNKPRFDRAANTFTFDVESYAATRSTAAVASICFERYGQERVYRAMVYDGIDEAEIQNIGQCFMQVDVPDENDFERLIEIEDEVEPALFARQVTSRSRKGKEEETGGGDISLVLRGHVSDITGKLFNSNHSFWSSLRRSIAP